MVLTQKEAIRLCKKQWFLVLEGKAKDKWEAWRMSGNPYPCMLCAYTGQHRCHSACDRCPLVKQFHVYCHNPGTNYKVNPKEFAALVMKLK